MIFSEPLYHVFRVKDQYSNKERILSEIYKKGRFLYRSTDSPSYISNTDWSKDDYNWFFKELSENDQLRYRTFISKKFGKSLLILDSWFNQYYAGSGSAHDVHDHEGCDLTAIYYVELSDRSLGTILKHPTTGKEISPNVKEGDIITFRSNIFHRSPPNFTNTCKTVISFNVSFA